MERRVGHMEVEAPGAPARPPPPPIGGGAGGRRLRADASRSCAGRYLHTTHPSSIIRIGYHHHPFFGQTVEIIRWLRRQHSESLVVKLQDGLELAIPAWMLDPLACSQVHDAAVPPPTVEALLALR